MSLKNCRAIRRGVVLLVGALTLSAAQAADKADIREKWHTPFDLYLDPVEAYEMKRADPQGVLFIDVRNRAEVQNVGFTEVVDANIPVFFFDTAEWKSKEGGRYGRYRRVYNEHFEQAVDRLLASRGLDRDAPLILMCKSGSRAPIAARLLHDAGYTRVYTQHEGFEGIKATSGPLEGKRQVNGWKNRGLPWSYRLPTEAMYFNFDPTRGQSGNLSAP
jgi:rhodanese-related sulfurtransferase